MTPDRMPDLVFLDTETTDYLPLITQRINRRRDPIAYITAAGEYLGLFADDEPAA